MSHAKNILCTIKKDMGREDKTLVLQPSPPSELPVCKTCWEKLEDPSTLFGQCSGPQSHHIKFVVPGEVQIKANIKNLRVL